jgi:exoribonuclease-2
VNQWQILACIRHAVAAPLSAPFKPKDADLFAIVSAFDSVHAAYAEFQAKMERYWCLRWLSQNHIRQVEAIVIRDEIVRLRDIPLTISLPAVRSLGRGTQVTIDLLRWDEIDLSVEARLVEVSAVAADADIVESGDEMEE